MAASSSTSVCSSKIFILKWNEIMKSFLIDDIEKLKYLWNTKHPLFAKRLQKNLGFQQVAMRMRERWPALESFLTPEVCIAKFLNLRTYYRKEKKKLTSSKSGTGAVDFFPKKEHFTRLQFLEDIINPVVCHPNLDDMELEINATLLEVTVSEDLIEAIIDTPSIPSGSKCTGSQLPQGERVYACTPKVKRRKSDAQEQFYSSMQTCLDARGKKTVNENFATYIASELDSMLCPKQQAVIRAKLRKVLDDCVAE